VSNDKDSRSAMKSALENMKIKKLPKLVKAKSIKNIIFIKDLSQRPFKK
jgi:hypothetical protein